MRVVNCVVAVSVFSILCLRGAQDGAESQRKGPSSTGRLAAVAQRAKAAGENRVELAGPIIMPTGITSAVELVKDYSILHFKVTDTAVTADNGDIRTWYKLRILDRISTQPQIPTVDGIGDPPPSLLPLKPDETIYIATAGAVTIDGVTIVQNPSERGLVLESGREYVGAFYLHAGGRYAAPAAASSGLYRVVNDELKPQGDEEDGLVRDVGRVFGHRLPQFRADIRKLMGSRREQ
jgi:hypothetical protein